MTTNKPHIEAYLVTRIKGQGYGKPRRILDAEVYDPTSDSFFAAGAKKNNTVEPLVSLSKYEVLQAECEKLRRDADRYRPLLETVQGEPMFGEIAASPRVDRVPVYAAPTTEQVERWRHDSEDLEVLHNNLDDAGAPRHDSSGIEYSEWGRVIQYAKAAAQAEADKMVLLSDYEALQADRDQQYVMKVMAREQRNAVTAKLDAMQAECDELRKDAERYRWLRDGNNEKESEAVHIAVNFYGFEWDEMIDIAMQGAQP
jgi:hypothetical protein